MKNQNIKPITKEDGLIETLALFRVFQISPVLSAVEGWFRDGFFDSEFWFAFS